MKFIRVIRKADIVKEYKQTLRLEMDYLLASLSEAIEKKDEEYAEKVKRRLKHVHRDLSELGEWE